MNNVQCVNCKNFRCEDIPITINNKVVNIINCFCSLDNHNVGYVYEKRYCSNFAARNNEN